MMKQFLVKLKSPFVLVGVLVVVVVLLGTILYVTLTSLNTNKTSSADQTTMVVPKEVQENLITANNDAKKEFSAHNSAAQALDEQQVKLAQ